MLATGEICAANEHPENLDHGPWLVGGCTGNEDSTNRLISRFRAAARKAAIAAGAPPRIHLLNWWISRLTRGQKLPYIPELIRRSSEFCEELESDSFEVPLAIVEAGRELTLRRDRYPCFPVPYWLYDEPRDPLPDPKEEYEYWNTHIWQGFGKMIDLTEHGSEPQDHRGRCQGETRVAFRKRVEQRQKYRYYVTGLALQGLSYDLAVLQANYIVDRRLRGDAAVGAFQDEVPAIMERIEKSWREISRRLGLSCRKQERDGIEIAKPFRQVGADLRQATMLESQDAAGGDNAAPQSIDTITTERRGATTVKSGTQRGAMPDLTDENLTPTDPLEKNPSPTDQMDVYDRRWELLGGPHELSIEQWELAARELALDLGYKDSSRAVDAVLDLVLKVSPRPYYYGGWRISELPRATAHCCQKLKIRARENGNEALAKVWGEFEGRFSQLDTQGLMAIQPYAVSPPELDLAHYLEPPTLQALGGRNQPANEPLAADSDAPVFEYRYPPDFPQNALLAIEAERIQADREFGKYAKFLRLERHFKALRLAWFRRVFLGGRRVIRELGISGQWGRNRIESIEAEFFKASAIAARIAVATSPEASLNSEATEMHPPDTNGSKVRGSTQRTPSSGNAGRRPNEALNRDIARVVATFGPDWRDQLPDLSDALNREKILLPRSKKWQRQGCKDWLDVLHEDKEGLVKAIRHRVEWVTEHPRD